MKVIKYHWEKFKDKLNKQKDIPSLLKGMTDI